MTMWFLPFGLSHKTITCFFKRNPVFIKQSVFLPLFLIKVAQKASWNKSTRSLLIINMEIAIKAFLWDNMKLIILTEMNTRGQSCGSCSRFVKTIETQIVHARANVCYFLSSHWVEDNKLVFLIVNINVIVKIGRKQEISSSRSLKHLREPPYCLLLNHNFLCEDLLVSVYLISDFINLSIWAVIDDQKLIVVLTQVDLR